MLTDKQLRSHVVRWVPEPARTLVSSLFVTHDHAERAAILTNLSHTLELDAGQADQRQDPGNAALLRLGAGFCALFADMMRSDLAAHAARSR